jgi:O-6-methylguanine DNA methyltransferase
LKNPGALIGWIVKSGEVRATFTKYEVPTWGVGELWTDGGLVLAHEIRFQAASDLAANGSEAAPPSGGSGPLFRTVPGNSSQLGNASVPDVQRSAASSRRRRPDTTSFGCGFEDALVGRFRAFFAGEEVELDDVPIDLDWATPFQRAVAGSLRAVPRGEVVSYGELAALAGYPGAARATGTFCAHNRFMLIVPCHRVVGAHGLGGYGSAGIETKRRLLELEGVRV